MPAEQVLGLPMAFNLYIYVKQPVRAITKSTKFVRVKPGRL
jgi:hypothetical protein